ncbi:hypothetical protein ABLO27_17410 [Roseibium sp. SCPC15]|jgi:hypothetical protein|uniref:hypothetical protein n=1 Tax=Roseibium sp. SCP15 TaxID=3141376 RepID=UPI00333A2613
MGASIFFMASLVIFTPPEEQERASFSINALLNFSPTRTTIGRIATLHCSTFFASLPRIRVLVSSGQIEVIGSGQMTIVRNLNVIAFLAAFAFLAAIVVGVI